jgi:hypothetical protein
MKRIDLIKVEHSRKIGDACEYIEPNVTERLYILCRRGANRILSN